MGLATDAINRLGLAADQTKAYLDNMPVAYAVTYMFGTMGSAIVIAVIGPKLLGIDLEAACKDYEEKHGGGKKEVGGPGTGWTRWALRAYKVQPGGRAAGLRVAEAESLVPDARLFILRIRRGGEIMDATADIVLKEGDVVAVAGEREVLVNILGAAAVEVEDRELLAVPVEGVDVLVTNKEVDGKTLAELATRPAARGVFLRKITRGATATDIPVLPGTEINRGDLLTLVGRTSDTTAATKMQGIGLFLWGAVATTVPLILGMFVAKYVFRFHDALNLGIISGSRTTTASLGLVCDQAKSQVPALGYTVTYAVGNTLLTIWGMILIMLLS